jgi:hypothetical protein
MLSIALSTIAFFVAAFYIKRYLEGMDIPEGTTRRTVIFSLALLVSYLVALAADHLPH